MAEGIVPKAQILKVTGSQSHRFTKSQVHKVKGSQSHRFSKSQVHKVTEILLGSAGHYAGRQEVGNGAQDEVILERQKFGEGSVHPGFSVADNLSIASKRRGRQGGAKPLRGGRPGGRRQQRLVICLHASEPA